VNSGAAPFLITAVAGEDVPAPDLNVFPDDAFFDDAANHPEDISVLQRIRLISQQQRVAVRITSRNPAQRRVVVLDVFPNPTVPAEPEKPKLPLAELEPKSPHIFIADAAEPNVIVQLQPPDGKLSVGNQDQQLTEGTVRIPVPEDSSQPVIATWTTSVTQTLERVSLFFELKRPLEDENATQTGGGVLETAGDLKALISGCARTPRCRCAWMPSRAANGTRSSPTTRHSPSVARTTWSSV
jgi:hypothetical protein